MKQKNATPGLDAVTIISTGVMLEGKISSNGNVRIDGSVKGDIYAKGNVTIGSQGDVTGEMHAQVITLGGKVNGSVIANEKITLEQTAFLKGDLVTKILVVEEGAVFEGSSSMSRKDGSPAIPEKDEKQ